MMAFLPNFFLDVQDGHLYFPIFFQFGRVGKEIVLLVCLIHHIVKADIYAADRGGFVNYFLIQQGKSFGNDTYGVGRYGERGGPVGGFCGIPGITHVKKNGIRDKALIHQSRQSRSTISLTMSSPSS